MKISLYFFLPLALKHTCRSDYLLLCKRQVAKTMFYYLKYLWFLVYVNHKWIYKYKVLRINSLYIPDVLNDLNKKQNHALLFPCHESECACLLSVKPILTLYKTQRKNVMKLNLRKVGNSSTHYACGLYPR